MKKEFLMSRDIKISKESRHNGGFRKRLLSFKLIDLTASTMDYSFLGCPLDTQVVSALQAASFLVFFIVEKYLVVFKKILGHVIEKFTIFGRS